MSEMSYDHERAAANKARHSTQDGNPAKHVHPRVGLLRALGSRVTLMVLLTCTALLGPARQVQAAPVTGNLLQALSAAPAGSTLYYTDWDLLRSYEGVPDLNSKSSMAARLRFMLSLNHGQALVSAFGAEYFQKQAKYWSWDSTDLAWESTSNSDDVPVYVLAFRPGFDLAPVIAHFTQRGFSRAMYHGTPIYAHPFSPSVDWMTDFSLVNTAVLADRHMLVLSFNPDQVRRVLDVIRRSAPSLADDVSVRQAAGALGPTGAAVVMPGLVACTSFSFSALSAKLMSGNPNVDTMRKQLEQELKLLRQLHSYTGFALGYHPEGKQPIGLLALHYPDAAAARADLVQRWSIATSGLGDISNRPYSADFFTVAGAAVQGSDLVLRLQPLHDQPQILFSLIFQGDMLFAACP